MPCIAEEQIPFGRREGTPPPAERMLAPDERVHIDTESVLADHNEMRRTVGIDGSLVANVNAGSKNFGIVDVRGTGNNRDFYIIDDDFSPRNRVGFKGVGKHSPVVIGRSSYKDRFDYPPTVSREHFKVSYEDDGLFITNLRPTNSTRVTAHLVERREEPEIRRRHVVDAIRTVEAVVRVQENPHFGEKDDTAPYGYYMNYPILGGHSTAVDGGVYLGGSAREAIVVDGKSTLMKEVYDDIAADMRGAFQRNETAPLQAILRNVMLKVQEVMPYDGPKTEHISRQHHGDKLVGLSTYLRERAGVCRHQGLMAAYLIERLIKDGHMMGAVGIERNTVEDLGGTHAWAVYKFSQYDNEQVIVVDPAQSFVGTKDQAFREGRWEYRLATDKSS